MDQSSICLRTEATPHQLHLEEPISGLLRVLLKQKQCLVQREARRSLERVRGNVSECRSLDFGDLFPQKLFQNSTLCSFISFPYPSYTDEVISADNGSNTIAL
jgi:hypothetical protein